MFEAMRTTAVLAQAADERSDSVVPAAVGARDGHAWAARARSGIEKQIGSLGAGKRADLLIVVDERGPADADGRSGVTPGLHDARRRRADDRSCNGKILMRDRKVLTLDDEERAGGRAGDGREGAGRGQVGTGIVGTAPSRRVLRSRLGALGMPAVAAGPDLQTLLDWPRRTSSASSASSRTSVAEEVYVQEMTSPRRKRTIKSEFLFVKYPDVVGAMALRDPFEVDGKPVRDGASADRMMKLFTSPVPRRDPAGARAGRGRSPLQPARHRHLEQSRLAMAFLQPNYRPRFRFNSGRHRKDLGPTIRTVRFEEFRVPSILKMGANQDMLARGLLWVDEQTGRVVKTRLQVGPFRDRSPESRHDLTATRKSLGIDVPAKMEDWYPDRQGEIRGTATYGRFRRFRVQTGIPEIGSAMGAEAPLLHLHDADEGAAGSAWAIEAVAHHKVVFDREAHVFHVHVHLAA